MIITTHEKLHIQVGTHTLRIPLTQPHLPLLQDTGVPPSALQGLPTHPQKRTCIEICTHRCCPHLRTGLRSPPQYRPSNRSPRWCLRLPHLGNKGQQSAARPTQDRHLRIKIESRPSNRPLLWQPTKRSGAQLPTTPSMVQLSDQTVPFSQTGNFKPTRTTARGKTSQDHHHVGQIETVVTNQRNIASGRKRVWSAVLAALRCPKSDIFYESNASHDRAWPSRRFGVRQIGENAV